LPKKDQIGCYSLYPDSALNNSATTLNSPPDQMSSILDELFDFQHGSTMSNPSPSPSPLAPPPPRHNQDSTEGQDNGSPPSSGDEDERQGPRASSNTEESPNAVAVFTINADLHTPAEHRGREITSPVQSGNPPFCSTSLHSHRSNVLSST
jgi:hypothetical protein